MLEKMSGKREPGTPDDYSLGASGTISFFTHSFSSDALTSALPLAFLLGTDDVEIHVTHFLTLSV